jgi:hypothetical protein
MALAVPQAHLRLRLCHQAIDDAVRDSGWDGKMGLEGKLLPGLQWWGERLKRKVSVSLRPFTPTVLVNTDASHYGWGAAIQADGQRAKLGEAWEEEGKERSSNLRELRAVREAIVGLVKKGLAPDTDMLVQSDNLTTVANINRRSCAISLLPEMLLLFDLLEQDSLRLRVSYIPEKENVEADALSRQTNAADYAMDEQIFLSLTEELGLTIGIDLFAAANNKKSRRFYSWRPSTGSLGTDALAHSWRGEDDRYAFPPTVLIPKILKKLREEKGRMLLITPNWASAPWGRELEEMTVDRRELGEILEFARRGNLVPTGNSDPPGVWIASLIRA